MAIRRPATVEEVLRQEEARSLVLTGRDRRGSWREAFEGLDGRVPTPFWLFSEDEHSALVLGFPLRTSPTWQRFQQELTGLATAEAEIRHGDTSTSAEALARQRTAVVQVLAEMLENALVHDYGRRFPELLWLAVSREMAERIDEAVRRLAARSHGLVEPKLTEIRWAVARRLADLGQRTEGEAVKRLRRWGSLETSADSLSFGRQMWRDLLPVAERRLTTGLPQLVHYVRAVHGIEAGRFSGVVAAAAGKLERLRRKEPAFQRALALLDPDLAREGDEALLLRDTALDLLAAWTGPDHPWLGEDVERVLREAGRALRRFEVTSMLRERIYPVSVSGTSTTARVGHKSLALSAFTRPLDFAAPGVLDSAVRRYGLLYDLVEFTAILEGIRRRGRAAEEAGMAFMVRFQQAVETIRERHRLKFEKFLGDGGFYSARSALSVLLAAAEIRLLYEELRGAGFPFDRGLRLAANVGAYHLLPMLTGEEEHLRFEFFGHGVVELARLTTGKTTHDVEDIADFLIASGYEVHRVMEFLEPVRHESTVPAAHRSRPYSAYVADNGELVNRGTVATEAFLRDLDGEWAGAPLHAASALGHRWLLLPLDLAAPMGAQIGLRYLGTAHLKGLRPLPLAEMVVFPEPLPGASRVPEEAGLVQALQQTAFHEDAGVPEAALADTGAVPPDLCVVSHLDNPQVRVWYIGIYEHPSDALVQAYRIPLEAVELRDGEPFEVWLHRSRGELAMLHQGLRRHGPGSELPLETLREKDGYFTCLLAAPHRSPR